MTHKAIKMTGVGREFLGFCETPSEYAQAAAEGREVFGFTGGQFSLIDIIQACLDVVEDPALTISTWTAAKSDMGHVYRFLETGAVNHTRWIVDRSFQNRQPELCDALRQAFGDSAVRVLRVHCKFALIGNKDSGLVLQTSANLNKNMRIENVSVTPCPVFYAAYQQLVTDVFSVQPPGSAFDDPAESTRTYKQLTLGGESWLERKVRLKTQRLENKIRGSRQH